MNNKGTGAIFCLISAILISSKYIAAAIFMSGVSSWDRSLFEAGMEYTGPYLTQFSVLALVVGILFLGFGIYKDIKENRK